MSQKKIQTLLVAFLAIFLSVSEPYAAEKPKDWEPRKKGFFYYKDPKAEEKKEKQTPLPHSKGNFTGTIDWSAVKEMHPAEISVLLDDVRDYAIQNPTKERVMAWLTLQKIVVDKASLFQQVATQVVKDNPILDATVERPPSKYVSTMLSSLKADRRESIISKMHDDMGLILFYTASCGAFCDEQRRVMKEFTSANNWQNVLEIDVSARPDLREEYQIQVVPDTWVIGNVSEEEEIKKMRVKAGVASWRQLETGLVNAYMEWFNDYGPRIEPYEMIMDWDTFLGSMPLSVDNQK